MDAGDYIKGKFQTFGISMSEADLLDISLNSNVDLDEEITKGNMASVSIGIAKFIPGLLLRPQSISEGGVSISYNVDAIKEYYSLLCKQYGIENELTPKPKATFY